MPDAAAAPEPEVITLGCRLNAYESEVMRGHARAAGMTDAVIVNTCAVTAEAERQARQAIRRARRRHPDRRIIVTGCAVQIAPERFAAMPEVDRVLGNGEKMRQASFAAAHPRLAVGDIMAVRETAHHLIGGFADRVRAFVEVQQGCDHRCTFCVIPFGRGNSRSVPLGEVVARVRELVRGGAGEVVLSGVDITSWGGDLPGRPTLGRMVRRLLAAVPELPRLRLGSLDPAEIDADLLAAVGDEPRLMPHLHLSLQAGDDLVLRRMKRRHDRAQALAVAAHLHRRRPDAVFGADLIAGFPTEDDAMFRRTLDLVRDAGLTYLHVFPFSPRAGTPAARMPQVPAAVRRERAAQLRAAGDAARAAFFRSRIGSTAVVLVERDGSGRTEQFAPARIDGHAAPGALVPADIVAAGADGLVARRRAPA